MNGRITDSIDQVVLLAPQSVNTPKSASRRSRALQVHHTLITDIGAGSTAIIREDRLGTSCLTEQHRLRPPDPRHERSRGARLDPHALECDVA